MPVPSYDDLAPSISDVHPRDTFDQVTRLAPSEQPVVSPTAHRTPASPKRDMLSSREGGCDVLFACHQDIGWQGAGLFALARDFSPRIERHGESCIVLDVSGLGRLLGDAHGIAAELRRAAEDRGLTPHDRDRPDTDGRVVDDPRGKNICGDCRPGRCTGATLTDRPQRPRSHPSHPSHPALAPCDILKRWGIRAVGEFAALPSDEVSARFGQEGVALQRLARGIDPRPLVPDGGVPRFIQSIELEWPIEELEPLSFVFARLLDPLAVTLERADRAAAAIRVALRLVDKITHARILQLPAPIRDPRVLRTLLLLDLESHPPSAGIDIVTIEIDPAPSRIVQFSLLERAIPSPETVATLTARLNALVGESRCGSPSLLDSHRPDAFEMQRFNPIDRCRLSPLSTLRSPASPQPRAPCRTRVPQSPYSSPLPSSDCGAGGGRAGPAGAHREYPQRGAERAC